MVIEREMEPPKKKFWEKIGKRNIIIASAVLLIGAAVWANFIFFDNEDGFDSYDTPNQQVNAQSGTGTDAAGEDTYFATMQVSRKRARDEALEVLQSVVDSADADEAVKTQAYSDINRLALEMKAESDIETLVTAKGFADCVAVISGDSATVVVKTSDGKSLLQNQIAQINEIVYEQAQILPVNIRITER